MELKDKYTIKKAIRVPQLKLEGGNSYAIKSMGEMTEEPTFGSNTSGTVTIMRVIDIETGLECNILLGAVLKDLFKSEDVYVGKCYLIDVGEITGDNQWRDYYLSEIDDPSTSSTGA